MMGFRLVPTLAAVSLAAGLATGHVRAGVAAAALLLLVDWLLARVRK
ncbi:hypothetical protein ACFQHO_28665 [Actinomadura yumaensis]|uniref:Uncharacterized protein n=2 Tax=Thermomonosporaceae TaxID=2012 RepID=A0ABW2CUH7_9ACTN